MRHVSAAPPPSGGATKVCGRYGSCAREPLRLAGLAVLCAAKILAANGLTGRYYDTETFSSLKTTRTDATVNFDWGTATPSGTALTSGDTFSVAWSGQLEPEFSGTHTFYVTADDGARLWIDDRLVVLRTFLAPSQEMRGQTRLTAGRRVNIRLEYIELTGTANVKLEWSCASRAREVIPAARLSPSREEKAGGALLLEHWGGIPGSAVAALTSAADFPQRPSGREFAPSFECLARDWTNACGTRVTGFIVPPETGSYTFAVSGDDTAELYLSTGAAPADKALVASVPAPTAFRDWDAHPAQQATPRLLLQGQRYYVELLHKQDSGAGHWSVGWKKPGDTAFSVVPGNALAQAGLDTPQPAEAALFDTLAREHPRLFATPERFARLRALWQSPAPSQPKTWAQNVINSANTLLTQPTATYSQDVRDTILSVSRATVDRLYKLGLAWQLTADSVYSERAWAELEAVAAFPDWHPAHFLDTAEMTHACAIGYDWLYAYWTPERRAVIRTAIVNHGLNAGLAQYTANVGWSKSTGNNWNMVCNGGMIIGALALGTESESLAKNIIHRALNSTRPVWARFTTDNGAWYEGPGYFGYTTEYGIRMLAALESALGSDFGISATPNLSEAGFAPILALGTSGRIFNFADAGASAALRGPIFTWFARRYGEPLFNGWQNQGNGGALDALWWDAQTATLADLALPPDMAFHGEATTAFPPQEMVTLRGNWSDPRATFLGCKGGEMGAAHGNLDAGTFVLDALGKRWFHDLGGDDYALPCYFNSTPSSGTDRWDYYRNRPEGQNTLTVNPSAAADMVLNAVAPLIAYQTKPAGSGSFAIHDLTPVYSGMTRVWRGFRLLGARNEVLVQDEIHAASGKTVWWFAHYAHPSTAVELAPDGTAATLTQGADRLWCKILSGGGTFQLMDAVPLPTSPAPAGQNANAGFRKLAVQLTGVTNATLAVWFVPLGSGQEPPAATPALAPLQSWTLATPNDPPAASSGQADAAPGDHTDIDLRAHVTDDATPPDAMRFAVGPAAHATVTLLPDGFTARLTPDPDAPAPPPFTFTATDCGPDPRTLLVYDFDLPDASAPNIIPDASGLGRDAAVTNIGTGAATLLPDTPPVFTRAGRSIDLAENGGANAASLRRVIPSGDLNFNTADWTVTGWFKRRDATNEDMVWHLNTGDGYGSNEELYLMAHGPSTLSLQHYPGPDVNITTPNAPPGVWHHTAVVRSGNTLSLYLNGTLVGSDNTFTLAINQANPLKFGGHMDTSANYAPRWFDGGLDDLAVFTAALDPAEIAALANGLTVRHLGGLTATGTVTLAEPARPHLWTNALPATDLTWSDPANWSPAAAPSGGRGAALAFFTGQALPAAAVTSRNDTAGGFALNTLTLDGSASATATVTLAGAPLTFLKNGVTAPALTLAATGANLTYDIAAPVTLADDTTLDAAGTAALRISGPLSGPAALTKTGNRTLVLSGSNTYAGATLITSGTLQIGADGPSGSLGAGPVVNDGQLRFDRTGTLPVPNPISGTGTLYIDCPINAGTVTLSGSNTFNGNVTVNSGALHITGSSALGTGPKLVTLSNGTAGAPQLRLDGSAAPIDLPAEITYRTSYASGAIINEAGTNTLRGDITLTGGGGDTRLLVTSGSLTFTGNLAPNTTQRRLQLAGAGAGAILGNIADGEGSNTLAVSKHDAGTWHLSGSNTFTRGLTVEAGRLVIAHPCALGNGTVSLSSGAALDLNGQTVSPPAPLTLRGHGSGGTGALVNNADLPAALTGTSAVTLAAHTTLGGTGDLHLALPLSGGYALTKTGPGTLTLAATNTYTGATTVSNGTLVLHADLPGALTAATGTLAPSGSPAVSGPLALHAGGRLSFRVHPPDAPAPNDRLTAASTVTLSGDLHLTAAPGLSPGSVFTLIDKTSSGAVTGTFAGKPENAAFTADGYIWRLSYTGGTGNDVTLTLLRPSAFTNLWDNTATGATLLWTHDANWQARAAALPSPDATVAFLTGQTLSPGTLASSNDTPGTFQLATLRLAGTGPDVAPAAVTLSGNPLSLGDGPAPAALQLDADAGPGGLAYTLALPLALAKTASVTGSGSAAFTLSGPLSGPGGLAKSATATLTLSGTNTHAGGTALAPHSGLLRAVADTSRNPLGTGPVSIATGAALALDIANTAPATLTLPNAFSGTGLLTLTFAASPSPRATALPGLSGFSGTLHVTGPAPAADRCDASGADAPDAALILDNGQHLALATSSAAFASLTLPSASAAHTNTLTLAPGHTLTLSGPGGLLVGTDSGGASLTRARFTGGGALAVTHPAANVTVGKAQAVQTTSNNALLDLAGLSRVTLGTPDAPLNELRVGFGLTATATLTLSDTRNTLAAAALHVGHSSGGNGGASTLILGAGENTLAADTLNLGLSKSSGTLRFASQAPGSPGTLTLSGRSRPAADLTLGAKTGTGTAATPTGTLDLRGHPAAVTAGTLTLAREDSNSATFLGGAAAHLLFDTGTFTASNLVMATKLAACPSAATATLTLGSGTFTLLPGGTFTLASQSGAGSASGTLNLLGGTLRTHADIRDGGGNAATTVNLDGATLDMTGRALGSAAAPIDTLHLRSGTLLNLGQLNGGAPLVKTGPGTLTLGGTNTYTGATVVSNGTLRLASPAALPPAAALELAPAAVLDLPFTGTQTVHTASIDGKPKPAGLYSSATLSPSLTGTGHLRVEWPPPDRTLLLLR